MNTNNTLCRQIYAINNVCHNFFGKIHKSTRTIIQLLTLEPFFPFIFSTLSLSLSLTNLLNMLLMKEKRKTKKYLQQQKLKEERH